MKTISASLCLLFLLFFSSQGWGQENTILLKGDDANAPTVHLKGMEIASAMKALAEMTDQTLFFVHGDEREIHIQVEGIPTKEWLPRVSAALGLNATFISKYNFWIINDGGPKVENWKPTRRERKSKRVNLTIVEADSEQLFHFLGKQLNINLFTDLPNRTFSAHLSDIPALVFLKAATRALGGELRSFGQIVSATTSNSDLPLTYRMDDETGEKNPAKIRLPKEKVYIVAKDIPLEDLTRFMRKTIRVGLHSTSRRRVSFMVENARLEDTLLALSATEDLVLIRDKGSLTWGRRSELIHGKTQKEERSASNPGEDTPLKAILSVGKRRWALFSDGTLVKDGDTIDSIPAPVKESCPSSVEVRIRQYRVGFTCPDFDSEIKVSIMPVLVPTSHNPGPVHVAPSKNTVVRYGGNHWGLKVGDCIATACYTFEGHDAPDHCATYGFPGEERERIEWKVIGMKVHRKSRMAVVRADIKPVLKDHEKPAETDFPDEFGIIMPTPWLFTVEKITSTGVQLRYMDGELQTLSF